MLKRYAVLWFVLITVVLSFAAYFLPLPREQKSLLVPIVLVLIPTLVCILLAFLTEDGEGIRKLFSTTRGAWKWVLIGAVLGATMRVAVLIVGRILGTSIQADLSAPGTTFVILAPSHSPGLKNSAGGASHWIAYLSPVPHWKLLFYWGFHGRSFTSSSSCQE